MIVEGISCIFQFQKSHTHVTDYAEHDLIVFCTDVWWMLEDFFSVDHCFHFNLGSFIPYVFILIKNDIFSASYPKIWLSIIASLMNH